MKGPQIFTPAMMPNRVATVSTALRKLRYFIATPLFHLALLKNPTLPHVGVGTDPWASGWSW